MARGTGRRRPRQEHGGGQEEQPQSDEENDEDSGGAPKRMATAAPMMRRSSSTIIESGTPRSLVVDPTHPMQNVMVRLPYEALLDQVSCLTRFKRVEKSEP